jgi:hypothetical protein
MGLYEKGVELEEKENKVDQEVVRKDSENKEIVKGNDQKEDNEKNPDKEYRTGIDRLYHLIKVSGKISVGEVKKIIEGDSGQIEAWINILDNQGLIVIEYPPTGGTLLRAKGVKPENFSIKKILHWGKKDEKAST